jgi:hypothetical protein
MHGSRSKIPSNKISSGSVAQRDLIPALGILSQFIPLSHGSRQQQQHPFPADITPAHYHDMSVSSSRYYFSFVNMPPAWLHLVSTNIRRFSKPYMVTMQIRISIRPRLEGSSQKIKDTFDGLILWSVSKRVLICADLWEENGGGCTSALRDFLSYSMEQSP